MTVKGHSGTVFAFLSSQEACVQTKQVLLLSSVLSLDRAISEAPSSPLACPSLQESWVVSGLLSYTFQC